MTEQQTTVNGSRAALGDHLQPELFRALCDPNRLTLIARLATANAPLTVTEASTCCGVHISGVSRHLSMLRRAGVIKASKQAREVRYELDSSALVSALRGLADAIEHCRMVCCDQTKEACHDGGIESCRSC